MMLLSKKQRDEIREEMLNTVLPIILRDKLLKLFLSHTAADERNRRTQEFLDKFQGQCGESEVKIMKFESALSTSESRVKELRKAIKKMRDALRKPNSEVHAAASKAAEIADKLLASLIPIEKPDKNDPCDISDAEKARMRKRFDKAAENYPAEKKPCKHHDRACHELPCGPDCPDYEEE